MCFIVYSVSSNFFRYKKIKKNNDSLTVMKFGILFQKF